MAKKHDEKKATLRELKFSRVGRRARLSGTAEQVTPVPPLLVSPTPETRGGAGVIPLPARGHSGLREDQFQSLRASFPGLDIEEMEKQFVAWNEDRGVTPESYVGALFGFIRKKVRRDGYG